MDEEIKSKKWKIRQEIRRKKLEVRIEKNGSFIAI
jgi:hypothetical protein